MKQHSNVKYLGCLLDKTVSGETMAHNLIDRINNKLKNAFFDTSIDRPFFYALIQPHFHYLCFAWCPNPTQILEHKI